MLAHAQAGGAELAIVTDVSAACGSQVISDGYRLVEVRRNQKGVGVATALLLEAGIPVVSQRDFRTLGLLRARLEPGYVPPVDSRDHHEDRGSVGADGMINRHTMAKLKVAITLDAALLGQVDTLVRERRFPNRSQAIESALAEKLERLSHARLARECAKLDPAEERRFADEGLTEDLESWPAYLEEKSVGQISNRHAVTSKPDCGQFSC